MMLSINKSLLSLVAALSCITILGAGDYSIRDLKLSKADGFYKIGESVVVSGRVYQKSKPARNCILRCNIKWEGKVIRSQNIPCDGKSFKVSYKGRKPGWVYFEFRLLDKNGKMINNPARRLAQRQKAKYLLAEIGAMYEPEKIRSSVPEPEDFDGFWQKQFKELAALPMDPVVKEIDSNDPAVKLYTVEVKCTGGRPATAYLAIPANAGAKAHGAVVDFLSWSWCDANRKLAIRRAKQGVIGLAATWHGLPVGEAPDFYRDRGAEFNKNHIRIKEVANAEKWFFTGMYLRVMRALQFVKSRPEWNGKDLVVQGGSLGGAQAAFAAAFDPAVTMAVMSVPGFCEFRGTADGRKNSIPFNRTNEKYTDAMYKGASYGDTVNICRRIKCETIFCTGFADEVCPPSNVYAAYNNLPADITKAITTNPYTGHGGTTKNVKGDARLAKFFKEVTVHNYLDR